MKLGKMPRREQKLYSQFCKQRSKNLSVSGNKLTKKAKAYNVILKKNKQFNVCNGWVQKFRKKFGIRFFAISRKKLSFHSEFVDLFK